MIEVKYVGKKPSAIDNLTQSGKTWNGHGDVQSVTVAQARRLIVYADQWELANPGDLDAVNEPVVTQVLDRDGKPVDVTENDLKRPLEKMSPAELVAVARTRFNKTLNVKMGRTRLIDEIEALDKGMDPITTSKSDLK